MLYGPVKPTEVELENTAMSILLIVMPGGTMFGEARNYFEEQLRSVMTGGT